MTPRIPLAVPVSERDHGQGLASAMVTLVQYGDYECPYTRQATSVVRAIQQQLGDQLRFVFRNFPLIDIHPHARGWSHACGFSDETRRSAGNDPQQFKVRNQDAAGIFERMCAATGLPRQSREPVSTEAA